MSTINISTAMTSAHPATDLAVPPTQKAAIIENSGSPLQIIEKRVVQASELQPGEVLVKLLYSGLVAIGV
jgi:hypothetical protein